MAFESHRVIPSEGDGELHVGGSAVVFLPDEWVGGPGLAEMAVSVAPSSSGNAVFRQLVSWLLEHDADGSPSFAVAVETADGILTMVAGRGRAELSRDGVTVDLAGELDGTWSHRIGSDVDAVVLGEAPQSANSRIDLRLGVVAAGGVELRPAGGPARRSVGGGSAVVGRTAAPNHGLSSDEIPSFVKAAPVVAPPPVRGAVSAPVAPRPYDAEAELGRGSGGVSRESGRGETPAAESVAEPEAEPDPAPPVVAESAEAAVEAPEPEAPAAESEPAEPESTAVDADGPADGPADLGFHDTLAPDEPGSDDDVAPGSTDAAADDEAPAVVEPTPRRWATPTSSNGGERGTNDTPTDDGAQSSPFLTFDTTGESRLDPAEPDEAVDSPADGDAADGADAVADGGRGGSAHDSRESDDLDVERFRTAARREPVRDLPNDDVERDRDEAGSVPEASDEVWRHATSDSNELVSTALPPRAGRRRLGRARSNESAERAEPVDDGLTVVGLECPQGHLNAPSWRVCATCGADLSKASPARGPHPGLGILQFDDGTSVPMDSGYVIGRRPDADAVGEPGLRPLEVTDESQSVSRNHAILRIEGWDLMVLDCGSSNGTHVEVGDEMLRLEPGAAYALSDGQRVVVGTRWFEFRSAGR